MFNAWPLNGAGLNSGSSGVRVLLASAVFAASASADCMPTKTVFKAADFDGFTILEAPRAVAQRAARSVGFPTAQFDPARPYDLLTLELSAHCLAYAEPLVYRMTGMEAIGHAAMGASAIRYAFFSTMESTASMPRVEGWAVRPGFADSPVTAEWDVLATRRHPGFVEGLVLGSASFDGDVFAGGITHFDLAASLFAEPHLNGIQPGWSVIEPEACLDSHGDRWAGGCADGEVFAEFTPEPLPGRGVAPTHMHVEASMWATWWTYIPENADLQARAAVDALASQIHATEADAHVSASIEAYWSRIVEPRERIVMATATLGADGHRIRPGYVDGSVQSWAEEDGRLVIHGVATGFAHATLVASPQRIVFSGAEPGAAAHLTNTRASVNLLNPAPEWRWMIVPEEDRTMVVPFENRTMVVR